MSETTAPAPAPARSFGAAVPAPTTPLDPDLADTAPREDVLAALAADLAVEVDELKRWAVPARPGWDVECSLGFDNRVIDNARKRSADPGFADKIDGVKMGAILLGRQTVAIYRHGVKLELDGQALTFQSRELHELVGAGGVVECVRKVFGRAGDLDAVGRALMEAAGWGGDAVEAEADPTA